MTCLHIHTTVAEIGPAAWDRLTDGQPQLSPRYLLALEETGCVGTGTGWHPRHLGLWEGQKLIAALPCYEKLHSFGEYVFDWAWARASAWRI